MKLIISANKLFQMGFYEESLEIYDEIQKKSDLDVSLNIQLAKQRIGNKAHNKVRVAVCLHLFYIDQWDFIKQYLSNIDCEFDLFITYPPSNYDAVMSLDLPSYTQLVEVPNIGMDVFPFIKIFHDKIYNNYDYVCKIHTKNTKSKIRELQRKILFDGVLGSTILINSIIDAFEANDSIGMAGAEYIYRCGQSLMYGNRNAFNSILSNMGYEDTNDLHYGFFAGTMFWARVDALSPLFECFEYLSTVFHNDITEVKTGVDGSIAHAMERVICALPSLLGYHSNILVYTRNLSYELVSRVEDVFLSINNFARKVGIPNMLDRMQKAVNDYSLISSSEYFDADYFRNQVIDITSLQLDPVLYYLLYYDFIDAEPSNKFSTKYYLLYNQDVLRKHINPLVHFISTGKKEGRSYRENHVKSLQLFNKLQFDNPLLTTLYSKFNSFNMARQLGIHFVNYYVENYLLDGLIYESVLSNIIVSGDEYLALKLAEREYIPDRSTIALLAIKLYRNHNWDSALRMWRLYYSCSLLGLRRNIELPAKKNFDTSGNSIFETIFPSKDLVVLDDDICVYTTLFGNFDDLKPILYKPKGIKFICFTDTPINAYGWEVVVCKPTITDSNLAAKIYKILPHIYLKEFKYSLFVDANTTIFGDFKFLINNYLVHHDFVMWKHPERCDVLKESEAIIQLLKHEPIKIVEQIKTYVEDGLPNDTGLVEASFIWRNHHNSELCEFMNAWWDEINKHSKRDQLSLGYLMWKRNLRPSVLPDRLGNPRKNSFFEKLPHGAFENKYTVKLKPNLVFLYHNKYKDTGSTIMRSFQLSEIVKSDNKVADLVNEIFCSDNLEHNNSLLFLNKGLLKLISLDELQRLKSNGNILLFDFVDDPVRKEIIHFADILISSSISSYLDNCRRYPDYKTWLITHHVDPRLPANLDSFDSFKAGYFGELVNTINIPEIVDFHLVSTAKKNDAWLDEIGCYNFHYALRRKRGIDGFKPFTKGFIAAHLGANMMIQRSESEAIYYLSHDYPYIYDGALEESQILGKLKEIKSDFGSSQWNFALDIMSDVKYRSSNEFICIEFCNLLNEIIGQ